MKNKFNKIVSVSLAAILTVGATSLPTMLANAYETINVKASTEKATVDARGVVSIPDINLRNALKETLRVTTDDEITVTALDALTGTMNLSTKNINNISGLEYCINITNLDLSNNQISDIRPLSGLTNLISLNLNNNQISNLSPLAGLTNITGLIASDNQISDISPLSGLTNLISLNLNNNQISNLSPLSSLINIDNLRLDNNQISDLKPLSGLTNNLVWLDLKDNEISDLSPLIGLTNIRTLTIRNNQISDLSPLIGLISYWSMDISKQTINMLEIETKNGVVTIDNPLINVDGSPIDLTGATISNSGSYDKTTNKIIWTGITSDINTTIDFSQNVTIGGQSGNFAGRITQPIKISSYDITVNTDANGTASVDKDVANIGETVTVTTTPNAGYELDTIKVNGTAIIGNNFTMPAEDVVVEVTFKAIDYTVTVNPTTNGTASVDKDVANIGETVTVTTTPNAGYELDTIKVNGTAIIGNNFTMPAEDVVVEVTFKAIDYDVKVDTNIFNGNISIDKTSANVGDIITLTINANEGYQLKEGTLKVITASGVEIPLTQMARMTNGTFTFEMPAEAITIFAEFELIPVVTPPVEPEVPEPPVVEPEKPQPPIVETKPETGKNPTTGTTGLVGILGAMGLAGATTLFTRKRKNK